MQRFTALSSNDDSVFPRTRELQHNHPSEGEVSRNRLGVPLCLSGCGGGGETTKDAGVMAIVHHHRFDRSLER